MNTSLFDVSLLSPILEENKIDSNLTNCYLFFLFFLQRCQFVANTIKLVIPDYEKSLTISIKYCLIHELDYSSIIKKIIEFRKEFDKTELITEILKFIKSSIDDKSTKSESSISNLQLVKIDNTNKTKLQSILLRFTSLKELLLQIENNLGELESFENYDGFRMNQKKLRLEKELSKLEESWSKNPVKNQELYNLLKNWFDI